MSRFGTYMRVNMLSPKLVAEKAGITAPTLHKYMRQGVKTMRVANMLAHVLNCTVEEIWENDKTS